MSETKKYGEAALIEFMEMLWGCYYDLFAPSDDDLVEKIVKIALSHISIVETPNKIYQQSIDLLPIKKEIRSLLQQRQLIKNAKELYKQWAKEMLEIHGKMTPHYWAAGESMLYWLQQRQPERLTVTREEIEEWHTKRDAWAESGDWIAFKDLLDLFKFLGFEVVKK